MLSGWILDLPIWLNGPTVRCAEAKNMEGVKMSVKVRFPLHLQKLTGGQEWVETTGHTVGECLDNLEIQFPGIKQRIYDEQGQLLSFYDIYVNSDSSYPEELAKPVKDEDELTIVPLIGGG